MRGLQDDIPAIPAIPAIRPTEFDELLAAKADTARPAVTGFHIELGLVEELHGSNR
jgi:hypothetical protein